jgi:endonuclease/exonuclease/phosphatase family metal-dependent hydrolase
MFSVVGVSAQNDSLLRVMSFNVKYDNPNDGPHSWSNRKLVCIDMIQKSHADIIGFQEVLHSQLSDLTEGLPGFKYVGVGRKDGATEGEYSVILYRSDRFEVLSSETFWLSEAPDSVASVGWDASMERICTWAVFMDKRLKEKIAVFNTHFDHIGEKARNSSSDLILNRMEKIAMDLPVILTGDFNADSDSRTIQKLTSGDFLVDSRNLCSQTSGPEWTFHGFGKVPENERTQIDFIFFRKDFFDVVAHSHLFQSSDQTYYSDHNPVLTVLHRTIKNE